MFPVEAQMTARAPSPSALLIATVMPRSLNEPVGLSALILQVNLYVVVRAVPRARTLSISGVLPSLSVTTGVSSVTGRKRR